jgi:hypothetical protein
MHSVSDVLALVPPAASSGDVLTAASFDVLGVLPPRSDSSVDVLAVVDAAAGRRDGYKLRGSIAALCHGRFMRSQKAQLERYNIRQQRHDRVLKERVSQSPWQISEKCNAWWMFRM